MLNKLLIWIECFFRKQNMTQFVLYMLHIDLAINLSIEKSFEILKHSY